MSEPMGAPNTIEDEALALLEQSAHLPDEQREQLFESFTAGSDAHAKALRSAQRYLCMLSQTDPRPFSKQEKRLIRRQVRIARMTEPRRWVPVAGILALLTAWLVTLNDQRVPSGAETVVAAPAKPAVNYETGRYHREIKLSDGSTLWLDWHSQISVSMQEDKRRLTFHRGRAAFSVAPDTRRPFEVSAGGLTTRVTGTQFEVDLRRSERPAISVVEGSVEVSFESQTLALRARDYVVLQGRDLELSASTFRDELSGWRDGRLVLRDVSLSEAIATLQHYSRFTVDTSKLAHLPARVSGTYFVERADDGLFGLFETHRLIVEQQGRTLVLRPPRLRPPGAL
ncbi:MAG: FecR domain-containing protein [Pseudomonadota bacterium]